MCILRDYGDFIQTECSSGRPIISENDTDITVQFCHKYGCQNITYPIVRIAKQREIRLRDNNVLVGALTCALMGEHSLLNKSRYEVVSKSDYEKSFDVNLNDCKSFSFEGACIRCLAIKRKDISYCYKIPKPKFYWTDPTEQCLRSTSPISRNQAGCNLIKEKQLRDFCYRDLAYYLNNTRICQKIEKEWIAETCLNLQTPISALNPKFSGVSEKV